MKKKNFFDNNECFQNNPYMLILGKSVVGSTVQ